jgi:hypothetical protein
LQYESGDSSESPIALRVEISQDSASFPLKQDVFGKLLAGRIASALGHPVISSTGSGNNTVEGIPTLRFMLSKYASANGQTYTAQLRIGLLDPAGGPPSALSGVEWNESRVKSAFTPPDDQADQLSFVMDAIDALVKKMDAAGMKQAVEKAAR